MSDKRREIEWLCDELERVAFSIPAPNRYTPTLVGLAIQIRNAAFEAQVRDPSEPAGFAEETETRLLTP